MLTEFDFHRTQLRYIKAAIHNVPAFPPDGMDAAVSNVTVT